MRRLAEICLSEKYYKSVKFSGADFWVFINPDPSDINDILSDPPFENTNDKAVRFGFTKNGDMYVWHYSCLHDKMERLLGKTLLIRGTLEWSPLAFYVSPETTAFYAEQVETKYVRTRLEKAFPEAKRLVDMFLVQLSATADQQAHRHAYAECACGMTRLVTLLGGSND